MNRMDKQKLKNLNTQLQVNNMRKQSKYRAMVAVIFGALILMSSGVAMAAPLTVTDFVPDEAATAADMNSKFDEVEVAVDDNDTRVTANEADILLLQSQVAALEAAANTTLQDKISGATYKWLSMDIYLGDRVGISGTGSMINQMVSFDDVLTFNSDFTINETFNFREWRIQIAPKQTTDASCSALVDDPRCVSSTEVLDLNVVENGLSTWALTGNTITFIGATGTVSQDGNVIIVSEYFNRDEADEFGSTAAREINFGVLVKISN